jgi:Zn-dependent peptidase ImmA (M78 family)/predicted HTH domain antitoxin
METRQRLGLGARPVWDMVALLEEEGVFVVETPFESEGLFGAFTYSEETGPCVLINTACTRGRQVTTAAHEYCHNLKDRDRVRAIVCGRHNEDEEIERYAYAFARHFLMPREGMLQFLDDIGALKRKIGAEDVVHLRWHFGVSYQVALLHLMYTGLLSKAAYKNLKDEGVWSLDRRLGYDPGGDRKEKPNGGYESIRRPRPLVELAVKAYQSGNVTLSRFAEIMGLARNEAAAFLEEVGVGVRTVDEDDVAAESDLA